ncbi:helix-turn-helix domain-containing protein [Echinicola sp. 20G]|uniref:helix-turn-helix domain-containing protein n=1 Tax=Echinicola sp. 20G TaxID=2781961 RepID=UPI0019100A0E|nr:helix-turn-helix transcriptional regulator [Echinicola sp. 20G]
MNDLDNPFTILENKTIGRNLYKMRKVKDVKALQLAEHIGITESAYTKYERGESKISIDLIQKVSEYLKVDPLQLIAPNQGNFFENVNNSPINSNFQTFNTVNEKQNEMMLSLMSSIVEMNKRLMELLEKK